MYRYRYVHDVPVVFSDLRLTPHPGDEIESESLIDHPYWKFLETDIESAGADDDQNLNESCSTISDIDNNGN